MRTQILRGGKLLRMRHSTEQVLDKTEVPSWCFRTRAMQIEFLQHWATGCLLGVMPTSRKEKFDCPGMRGIN